MNTLNSRFVRWLNIRLDKFILFISFLPEQTKKYLIFHFYLIKQTCIIYFSFTWLDIGLTSTAISRCLIIFMICGCL